MLKKMILMLCFVLIVAGGCSARIEENTDQEKQKNLSTINNFYAFINNNPGVEEIINFIDNSISSVSNQNASIMVNELERIQKKDLPVFEEMFNHDNIQIKFSKEEYNSLQKEPDKVKDSELREILSKTIKSGYKVETAEGSFFPIINYESYKKYNSYVTSDLMDYIEIMAVESNKVPAKDAAIVISWNEILNRAINQERFINNHGNSNKSGDIKELYKKYVYFIFYGANNTPLFSYDSKTMTNEAKTAYLTFVKADVDSKLLNTLRNFLEIAKNNSYSLTNDVVQFRENAVKELID